MCAVLDMPAEHAPAARTTGTVIECNNDGDWASILVAISVEALHLFQDGQRVLVEGAESPPNGSRALTALRQCIDDMPIGWVDGRLVRHRSTTETDVITWAQRLKKLSAGLTEAWPAPPSLPCGHRVEDLVAGDVTHCGACVRARLKLATTPPPAQDGGDAAKKPDLASNTDNSAAPTA